MTSFVSALITAMLCFSCAVEADSAAPADLSQRVSETIADEWGAPPSSVEIEWGHVPQAVSTASEIPFRLTGAGVGGWFSVVVELSRGDRLALRVRAGVRDTVWVAARPLGMGTRLDAGDLIPEVRLHWGPPRPHAVPPAEGWEVRRPLSKGDEVAWPAVTAPAMVSAGDEIRVEWSRGDVRVVVTGVALNSAARGGVVRIRVPERSGSLQGVVVAPGRAILREGGRS